MRLEFVQQHRCIAPIPGVSRRPESRPPRRGPAAAPLAIVAADSLSSCREGGARPHGFRAGRRCGCAGVRGDHRSLRGTGPRVTPYDMALDITVAKPGKVRDDCRGDNAAGRLRAPGRSMIGGTRRYRCACWPARAYPRAMPAPIQSASLATPALMPSCRALRMDSAADRGRYPAGRDGACRYGARGVTLSRQEAGRAA